MVLTLTPRDVTVSLYVPSMDIEPVAMRRANRTDEQLKRDFQHWLYHQMGEYVAVRDIHVSGAYNRAA